MNARLIAIATATTLVVLCIVGFVDSIIDDRAGPAVLFAMIAVGIGGLYRARTAEPAVTMRRDLVSWLERTSPVTGETVEELSDRAVSRLRAGFVDLPQDEP